MKMVEFPTYEEMGKKVAEKALDEILYDGKSIREWMRIIVSEDAISRQAAIDACLNGWNKDYKEIVEEIRALPPVTPQYTEAEIQKMQDLEFAEIQKAYEIGKDEGSSENPNKTGHWRHYENMLYCSECGEAYYDDIMEYCGDDVPKYCPSCGCKMTASPTGAEGSDKE